MNNYLFGAIAGDICGTYYEFGAARTKDYDKVKLVKKENRFSDDTVCTIAVADAILKYKNPTVEQFGDCIQEWCKKYPKRGYGGKFRDWIINPIPYGSWGNGSAMRVSPCGLIKGRINNCTKLAEDSALCSHNTEQAVTGATVTAQAVFWAKNQKNDAKWNIKNLLEEKYPEYVGKTLNDIRPTYKFDSSCDGTVPVALLCFLESESYENCIKLAISMGGDSDTLAAIAGSIAYPFYGEMQKVLSDHVAELLPADMMRVVREFDKLCE